MTEIIKSCFMDEQPDFYKEVYLNNVLIGTVRSLTEEDNDIIRRRSLSAPFINEERKLAMNVFPEAMKIIKVTLALGGIVGGKSFKYGQEGWTLKDNTGKIREVTEDNVNKLHPAYLELFLKAIEEQERFWKENKEAILKNLN